MKASNHRNGQAALAAEHLGEARATVEDGFQVVACWTACTWWSRNNVSPKRPHSALGYRPPAPEAIVPSWPFGSAPPAAQLGLSGRSGLTLLLDHQVQAVQHDLEAILGSRTRVSEVLSGKRGLSIAMIRRLHEQLGIPADVLIRAPARRKAA